MIATTTLNKIRSHQPCTDGWETLLRSLGKKKSDDEELTLAYILKSNGLDDALWCLKASDADKNDMRRFAVWCARQVEHLMDDERSKKALEVAELYADGKATDEELAAAEKAAEKAAWDAAQATARDAAWAARDAAWAARDAAWAAWDAAWAARGAASDAAWSAARLAQKQKFIEMFCTA